jgi:hypothetical protein
VTLEDVLWDLHKRLLSLPNEASRNEGKKMATDYSIKRVEGKTAEEVAQEEYAVAMDIYGELKRFNELLLNRYSSNHHEIAQVRAVLSEALTKYATAVKMLAVRETRTKKQMEALLSYDVDKEKANDIISDGAIIVNDAMIRKVQDTLKGE